MIATDEQMPVAVVTQCDIGDRLSHIPAPRPGIEALILVRLFSEPIGMLNKTLPAEGLAPSDLGAAIVREFAVPLRERFEECGLDWTGELPTDGLTPPRTPAFELSREQVLREGPQMTVAICTHDRPDTLAIALKSVCAQDYDRLRVLVVDNAPSDDRSQRVVSALADQADIQYAVEPRPGLSWARNRAIELADGDVIAWVDDDEFCDEWWAVEIARGFVEVPGADAVTGTVIPSELETPSQMFFERYGSVRRHRGFARAVFSPETRHLQSPLYPAPPFGIGANMAFRRDALDRIGGFDCALGAGTLTKTAEDTAALSALLLAGGTIVYQPTSIVYHRNRRESGVLEALLRGHGRGLGAFYTSMLLRRPTCVGELLRLTPQAFRQKFATRDQHLGGQSHAFPRELVRANRIGLLEGPFAYAAARFQARRLRNSG